MKRVVEETSKLLSFSSRSNSSNSSCSNNNNNEQQQQRPHLHNSHNNSPRHNKHELSLSSVRDIEQLAQKRGANVAEERFKIVPADAYPNVRLNREELRKEMNKQSHYFHPTSSSTSTSNNNTSHDDKSSTTTNSPVVIGQLATEILQCFGLPKARSNVAAGETSDYCVAVLGNAAFQTDVMPAVANPMWLSKMRRACLFNIHNGYARLYVGVFGWQTNLPPPHLKKMGFRGGHHRNNNHDNKARNNNDDDKHHHHGPNNGGGRNEKMSLSSTSSSNIKRDTFVGRIVIDVATLRPGCTYDVTLPLRTSAHVYSRHARGAIRLRLHLEWFAPRQALLSYLPRSVTQYTFRSSRDKQRTTQSSQSSKQQQQVQFNNTPNASSFVTVPCADAKAFQNVARVVHGAHMPHRFSFEQATATVHEFNWTRIHVLRYVRKREVQNVMQWRYPAISAFLFLAWMHGVYKGTWRYMPGHFIIYLWLHLMKNYGAYALNDALHNGFLAPTWEELMCSLLWGSRNQSSQNSKKRAPPCIAPLEMQAQETTAITSSMAATCTESNVISEDTPTFTLQQVADCFRSDMQTTTHRMRFHVYREAFTGKRAVNFLIANQFAACRASAVALGQRLAQELHLFDVAAPHKTNSDNAFTDSEHAWYVFLSFDANQYTMTTHRPWGQTMFRLLGLGPDPKVPHLPLVEMPFNDTGMKTQHDRFTVKESLVIRSRASKKRMMLEAEEDTENGSDAPANLPLGRKPDDLLTDSMASLSRSASSSSMASSTYWHSAQFARRFDQFCNGGPTATDDTEQETSFHDVTQTVGSEHGQDVDTVFNLDEYNVKMLQGPPQQDAHVKNKNDTKPADILNEAREKNHEVLLHLFHDRVFLPPSPMAESTQETRRLNFLRRNLSSKSSVGASSEYGTPSASGVPPSNTTSSSYAPTPAEVEEYHKLLGTGKHSHGNPWIAKVGEIVQPMMEIVLEWLCLFRALYNIFTWRDPMLSFWVSLLAPIVAVVFHLFPWRITLGIVGLVFLGPQNWVFRIIRERKEGYQPVNMDRVVKRKKKSEELTPIFKEDGLGKEAIFSSTVRGNSPIDCEMVDRSHVRRVVVPYSQLMYRRFYDWPPEFEYARVTAEEAPTNAIDEEAFTEDISVMTSTTKHDTKGPRQILGRLAGKIKPRNLKGRIRNRSWQKVPQDDLS